MFNVFDCGARGGKHRSWQHVDLNVNYYMFEPEGEEFNQLSISSEDNVNVINCAVADKEYIGNLNVYSDASLSSLLALDTCKIGRYKDVTLVEQIPVNVTTIGKLCDEFNIQPHFLCIDAQGMSLEIIKGCDSFLSNVLAIRAEAEFFKFYKNENTIFELGSWLTSNGYEMARFETCGPGRFGPSSDMNSFSVDCEDAKPVWADFIFVNEMLVNKLINNISTENIELLLGLITFLIHNRCGYLALEIFGKFDANKLHDIDKYLLVKTLPLMTYYLSIPRRDYNKGNSYANTINELMSLMKTLSITNTLNSDVMTKIDAIYK